jgi:hypothetical protein
MGRLRHDRKDEIRRVLSLTQPTRPRSTHPPVGPLRCGCLVKDAPWRGRVGWVKTIRPGQRHPPRNEFSNTGGEGRRASLEGPSYFKRTVEVAGRHESSSPA